MFHNTVPRSVYVTKFFFYIIDARKKVNLEYTSPNKLQHMINICKLQV